MIRQAIITTMAVLLMASTGVQAGGDPDRGGDFATDCISCHGSDGKGSFETPPIIGLDETYIYEQLKAFQSGQRESMDGIMHLYSEDLDDQDLQDLAAYWSTLQAP